ncbi:MAG: HupE/UreJ family protein [Bryobacterales bacterium]|nr:HupE/UreJ family protein [Acidobacteriota bacterium]MCB9384146.1 HupE/UreJ family protein [Bryobacterales bacterium]
MTLHVPLSELELAFGHQVTDHAQQNLPSWGPDFRAYLVAHIRPRSASGLPWTVRVADMRVADAEQIQSGPFQEILVRLALAPPPGADPRRFVLDYDLILHQVVTHKAVVSVERDWESGQVESRRLGVIAVNTTTARVDPFPVDLGDGGWIDGFAGMVRLGMEHIREGADHLLFLLVLLLPATLTVNAGPRGSLAWGSFGGSLYSLSRLAKIVTAFTLGHSLTLLAGALHWLALPQQPVEVLIAFSVLVTAVHALRPIFPGREALVAAGFGLVHGLAFATVLADLQLPAGPLALSIFGFNLGIELMQLLVVAVTIPWLVLLSMTPAHRPVRIAGALLSATAAAGWIVSRISGQPNPVDRAMTFASEYAPLAVLVLALIATSAYAYAAVVRQTERCAPISEQGSN